MAKDNFIKLDHHTYTVISEAIDSCSETESHIIEKEIGVNPDVLVKLQKKYNEPPDYSLDISDLPIVIKALEWMLITKNDSDILQVHREDGLRLLKILQKLPREIKSSAWQLYSI